MVLLNNKLLLFILQLIYWGTPVESTENVIARNDDTKTKSAKSSGASYSVFSDGENSEDFRRGDETSKIEHLNRTKRFITTGFCINYPMCCDIGGKDTCAFFCPVCPIQRDYFGRPITTTTENPQQALIKLVTSGKLQPSIRKRLPARVQALISAVGGGQGGGGGGGLAALLAGAGGGQGGGGGLAALLAGAGGGQGGGGGLAALLRGAAGGQGGGGGLAALLGGAGQGSGGNSASQKGGSDLAGMMVVAAMIGAQLATDSKPDQPTASSGGDGPEEPDVTGSLATLIPAICARPEIIKNLIRQDPERVRNLARQFGFGELPENLTPENLDLSPICGKPGEPRPPPGLFGLPDLFANETVDVQGFGDYDYGDDYEDDEINTSDEVFDDDYEGDFEGDYEDNSLSNESSENKDDNVRRNFNVGSSRTKHHKNNRHQYFIDEFSTESHPIPNHRVPKQITHPEKFETLQAPLLKKRHRFDTGDRNVNQDKKVYPDVIALVDDQYIQEKRSRRKFRPLRRPTSRQRYGVRYRRRH